MDEGWTRWLLEKSEFPYTTLHPEDVRGGSLAGRFDAVVLPDAGATTLLRGLTAGSVPPQYRGGIEEAGLDALRKLVDSGGTIIALGQSCELVIDKFSAPFRDAVRGLRREEFLCPGSILRIRLDPSHPLAYGMPDEADACFSSSMVLEPVPSFQSMQSAVVARYPDGEILRSGWLEGEKHLRGRIAAAEVRLGRGRLVLFPIRVQHRAQPHGTFKLLFNAILTSAASLEDFPATSPRRKKQPPRH